MRSPRSRRGSALLVAIIAIAVLMLLVVAAIQFTGTNRDAASAKLRGDELASCAESARRALINQLISANTTIRGRNFSFELIDQVEASERTRIDTAHYDGVDAGTANITIVAASQIGSNARDARDLSNAAPTSHGFGGTPYRVVMRCKDRGNREQEVEFVFRYGI